MGTFISILFLLQLVAFAAITVLYLQLKRSKQLYEEQKELAEQMEQSMALFIDEMKSENANLLSLLDRQMVARKAEPAVRVEQTERKEAPSRDEEYDGDEKRDVTVRPVVPQVVAARAYNRGQSAQSPGRIDDETTAETEQLVETDEKEEADERSFHDRVAILADRGATVESIARELNCGTTEVELSLKFRR